MINHKSEKMTSIIKEINLKRIAASEFEFGGVEVKRHFGSEGYLFSGADNYEGQEFFCLRFQLNF